MLQRHSLAGHVHVECSQIGARCRIAPFTYVGEDVEIGDDSVIGASATLVNCSIGSHVVLHSGVRIGQDGFGFQLAPSGGDHAKKPQELRVEIHDHVEIGYRPYYPFMDLMGCSLYCSGF